MKRTAIAGVLALVSVAAQAGHEGATWKVGAAASFADFSWSDGEADLVDDSAVGAKFTVQYRFNDWLALEGAYHNTGEFKESQPNDLVDSDNNLIAPAGSYDLSFKGFSASALVYLPLPGSDDIDFYVKGGYFDFDDELGLNGRVTSNGSESGIVAGAGALIGISEHFGIRADADWFDADVGDLWMVNLGLEYSFGGSRSSSGGSSAPPADDAAAGE